MDGKLIEIAPLCESAIPEASRLVWGYMNASLEGTGDALIKSDQLAHGEGVLHRLLTFRTAECCLAKMDQQYVGVILLSWSFSLSKGYPVLRVEALYTLPEFRKRGVGRKLLEHAAELARQNKANRLQLETDHDNAPARALYEGLGFQLMREKRVYMLFL
jgi:ribosomal protein S18 acetylase RimI-like enzyme